MPWMLSCEESTCLASLIRAVEGDRFRSHLRRLNLLFDLYVRTSPEPIPAPGLLITREIRCQCEHYLPIADISRLFNHLFLAALRYPPLLDSTPFHRSMSWADTFATLPQRFQFSSNPARLLETLLDDHNMLTDFLFSSFLPHRFYGRIGRYPDQWHHITGWLAARSPAKLRVLDAACGTGEETHHLALLLADHGIDPHSITVSGWTIEPLEVWSASHARIPHDPQRDRLYQQLAARLKAGELNGCLHFSGVDLTRPLTGEAARFDLIICNGLVGGPIIHGEHQLELLITNLAQLLAPGGLLLMADHFHGGWKKKCPQDRLRALLELHGLHSFIAGEGVGALHPD